MYYYYRYRGEHKSRENSYLVSFRRITPPFNSIHNILWHVFSWLKGSKFYEYQIVKNNRIFSKAEVCPKLPIFPFMKRGGYHIGPCMTINEERGKGFYPLLLQYIIRENSEMDYYMIVDENNIASQKGIEKVNFQMFAKGHKDCFGRYVIDELL